MVFVSGEVLIASKLEDANEKNAVSGYAGLNGGGVLAITNFNAENNNGHLFYWNADYNTHIDVSGVWSIMGRVPDYYPFLPTVYDKDLTDTGHSIVNNGGVDLQEIKWSNLRLIKGQYTINVYYDELSTGGILEILHGSGSIVTQDTYGNDLNKLLTVSCSTNYKTADFRIRVNGKNPSSPSGWRLRLNKVEIIGE